MSSRRSFNIIKKLRSISSTQAVYKQLSPFLTTKNSAGLSTSLNSEFLEEDELDLKFIPKSRMPNAHPFGMKSEPSNKKDTDTKIQVKEYEEEEVKKALLENKAIIQSLTSGRGNLGSTIEDPMSDNPQSQPSEERISGLAFHAWEQKMRENPLPAMSALEQLRATNSSDPAHKNKDVLSVMVDPEVLKGAFISMYCRHGSIEDAKLHLERKAETWLYKIASRLSNGLYTFPQPSQLEPKAMLTPKYDGTLDQVPVWWHKTIIEAMRMVLDAIYEPSFARSSHGYRTGKGCYTALKHVKYNFGGVSYFLVGDLNQCLEKYDRETLETLLSARISDRKFMSLISQAILAGFVDISTISFKHVGSAQRTLISPVLCNIYLSPLDFWMEDMIRCVEAGGTNNSAFSRSLMGMHSIISDRERASTARIKYSKAWKAATLKGFSYVRYGTGFLIGLDGTDLDVEQFELDLIKFIKTDLRLDYKQFKYNRAASATPDKEYVVFLGTEIYMAPQISSPGQEKGLSPGNPVAGRLPQRPRLCVPARYLLSKLEEGGFTDVYRKKPKFNGKMVHWECHEIVKYFDITNKLFYLYYTFADNYHCLSLLHDILKQSCALTLAKKLSLRRMWHVHKRVGKDMVIRDSYGNVLASFERPMYVKPADPFVGRDINPFARLERPSKPKFPPVKIMDGLVEPKFPIDRFKNVKSAILNKDLI